MLSINGCSILMPCYFLFTYRKAKGKCVKHAAAEPLRAQVEVR